MEEEKEKSQTSNTSNPGSGSLPSQVSKQPSGSVRSKKSSVEVDPRFDECVESEETPVDQAEKEFLEGKEYLMKQISKDGISLYDHLSQLINKVLSEKPKNAMETIEEDSQYLKEARFRYTAEGLRDVYTPPIGYERAKLLINLFKKEEPKEDEEVQPEVEVDEDQQPIKTDLMEHIFYCEKIGVAISRSEMICIAMSLDKLGTSQAVSKYRFWGKIFGLFKNYYIAEVILTDEEYAKRKDEIIAAAEEELKKEEEALPEEGDGGGDADKEEAPQRETKKNENLGGKGDADTAIGEGEELTIEGGGEGEEEEEKQEVKEPPVIPEPPKSAYKKPPEVPAEYPGEGTNKNVFYVCNEPGDEWIELPDVTPQQIAVARKIRKYFTGFLDYNVITYPPFPGLEANYLRAQIARISAGTHVSPLGFYGFNVGGEEEEEEVDEEEDEEGGQKSYQEDPHFPGLPLKDLMDSTMSFWVHHELYILKQGRTTWWSPKEKKHGEEGDEEEEAEEEEDEEDVIEPEVGPAILTPLSEDATIEGVPPWSTRSSSDLIPSLALGIIRSNLWPGAYAFAKGRKCDNVYIGWGHKRVAENYSPPGLPQIQLEYPLGPEIMEIDDPTPEQEEAWRIAHEEKKKPPEEEEGEEEEEEEEEEAEDN